MLFCHAVHSWTGCINHHHEDQKTIIPTVKGNQEGFCKTSETFSEIMKTGLNARKVE